MIVLSITGASGVVYGVRLAEELKKRKCSLEIVLTDAAKKVLKEEYAEGLNRLAGYGNLHSESEIDAAISSGSSGFEAVVICPCSMKTLAAIAHGFSHNLVTRTADVALKERRRLILVPRETPFNAIHLSNMEHLATLGATILPASPAFYHHPKTVDDMINHVVGKILESLGFEQKLYRRWRN